MTTDPLAVANLALTLLSKTSEALNTLRERAQRTKDLDIKDQIGTLYDNVLSLKEVVSRLVDENKDLHRQLEQKEEKPTRKVVGDTIYYYQGNEGPFCQRCYDGPANKLVALLPSHPWGGGIRRECPVCGEYSYEKRMSSGSIRVGGRHGGGPQGWMGS